jgi:hypothetical protein
VAQTTAQGAADDRRRGLPCENVGRRSRRGNRRRDRRRAGTTGCLIRDHLAFNFRRRWPARLVRLGLPGFLRSSLRTDVLSEAMTRAAALIAAMERVEARLMSECVTRLVQPEEARAIANEIIRAEIARMLTAEADPTPRLAADVDARIAALSAEIAALREGLRLTGPQYRKGAPRPLRSLVERTKRWMVQPGSTRFAGNGLSEFDAVTNRFSWLELDG